MVSAYEMMKNIRNQVHTIFSFLDIISGQNVISLYNFTINDQIEMAITSAYFI